MDEGSRVGLDVSDGGQHVPIPPMAGRSSPDVPRMFEDNGLLVTPVQRHDSAVAGINSAGFAPHAVQTVGGGPGVVLKEGPGSSLNQPHDTTLELDYF